MSLRRLILKVTGWVAFALLALALLAFNTALVWIATGPRQVPQAVPYLEAALAPEDSAYVTKVGEVWLIWDGWRHPVDIRLKHIDVLTAQGERFAAFPEISVGLSLPPLFAGRIEPRSVTLHHPVISLLKDSEGHISFGLPKTKDGEATAAPEAEKSAPVAGMLGAVMQGKHPALSRLREVHINGGDISVATLDQGILLQARDVNLGLKRGARTSRLSASAILVQENSEALLNAGLTLQKQNLAGSGTLQVQGLMPRALLPLISDPTVREALQALNFPVNAGIEMTLAENAELTSLRYIIDGGKGEIAAPQFETPLAVEALHADGTVTQFTHFTAEHFSLTTGAVAVNASGALTLGEQGPAITARVMLKNAVAADIGRLWPATLAPKSRNWLAKNIDEGRIPEATVDVQIAAGDLALPELPAQDIDATIRVEGARLRPLPEQEPLRGINAIVRVDGKSLSADIAQGEGYSASTFSNGKLFIENLNLENPRIQVSFDIVTVARDIAEFLSHPPAQRAERLNINPETAQGNATGTVKLGFYYSTPLDEKGKPREDMGVDFDIVGTGTQITLPGFLGKFDVQDGQGQFHLDNRAVEFSGTGIANTVATEAQVTYLFEPENGVDTFLNVTTHAPVEAFKRFGYPEFSFLSGALGIKAEMKIGPAGEQVKGTFDLKDAAIAFKGFPWEKPAGLPATLALLTRQDKAGLVIESFDLASDSMNARGSGALSKDYSEFRRLQLDAVRWGESDLSLLYEKSESGVYTVDAKGAAADLRPWTKDDTNDFSFNHFPKLDLWSDVGRVIVKEGREVRNFRGALRCGKGYCEQADLRGTVLEKPFSMAIGGAPRTIRIAAADAGSFLYAFDIYDNMRGGDLLLEGTYDDRKASRPLQAKLTVGEHSIEHAPTLAQLLTLASLTGFVDTLQGNGIGFKKLEAPFTLENDVVTLARTRTYGPAVGINTEGTITFPGQKLDLKGTVVPSYTLNNVLSNVPLLGDILTDNGEGIIGARFAMQGTADNPEVSVNPLSILTPGILRDVFDVFDAPEKKKEKSEESSPRSQETIP